MFHVEPQSIILSSLQHLDLCPLCSSEEAKPLFEVKDHFSSQEVFSISQCPSCSFIFTNPRPVESELARYYDSENYISHSKDAKGFINRLYRFAQNFNLTLKYNSIKNHVPRGTWLDYGCGNGAFLRFLIDKGLSAEGYEPSPIAIQHNLANASLIYKKTEQIPKHDSYTAITMWHVLEHVPNPEEVLLEHYSRLEDNGVLILALPNCESYDAKHYKEYWAAYDVPRHLWHFTEQTITHFTEKCGFTLVDIKPLILDSFYVSLLSEKYSGGNVLKALISGLRSNISALKKKTPYSSQIYIFKKRL
jgi:2-polyprenyl-3-methyl-5-hydroxy-6-metoxy-1,4-benzoquinol methylase